MRRLRALGRLLHAVGHGLHGLAIVLLSFPSLDAAARHERIRWWSTKMLATLGITFERDGTPLDAGGLLAVNHVSWLDIMAVHAVVPRARFVSKADVKSWPLVSRLVDSAGTLYLERERKRDALRVVHVVADALAAGQVVAIFPEGTTSSGHGLLPFHANLLQAAVASGAPVQPVALRFSETGRAGQRGGRVRRRHDSAAKPLAHGVRRRRPRSPAVSAAARFGRGRPARARGATAGRHRRRARRRRPDAVA